VSLWAAVRRVRTRRAAAVVLAVVVPLVVSAPAVPSGAASTTLDDGVTGQGAAAARRVVDVVVTGRGAPGSTRTFTGRVDGAATGSPVVVQRRTETGWTAAVRGTTRAQGAFALEVRTARFGNAQYRVHAPAWRGLPAVSGRVRDVGAYGDLRTALAGPVRCLGAQALDPALAPCDNPALDGTVTPDPRRAGWDQDNQGAYACYTADPAQPVKSCAYGSRAKDALQVAVVGDSHGAMLLPGVKDVAARLNWRVHTYVARGCVLADPGPREDGCHARRSDLLTRLVAERYDVVIVTGYRNASARPEAMAAAWRRLQAVGSTVAVVADTPRLSETVLACVTSARTVAAAERCSMDRAAALAVPDDLVVAQRATPGSILVDSTDLLCGPARCRPVVGHVMAYRDQHHLSATYSRTLTPYRLQAVVAGL